MIELDIEFSQELSTRQKILSEVKMYVFGNGVILSVNSDSSKHIIEVSVPSYIKRKDSNGKYESSPGKIRLTYWRNNGPKIDGLIPYLRANETQVMFTAEETMSKDKNDKWHTNYTGIAITFANVAKNQRPTAVAQKPAPSVDNFQEVEVEEEEDEFGDYEL